MARISRGSRNVPVFNFNVPHDYDARSRAGMRMKAEQLEAQIEGGDFEDYMYNKLKLDEASVAREMQKARQILENRRLAADHDGQ